MTVPYSIFYYEKVINKVIPGLPKTARLRIRKAIEERLTLDPVSYGKPLQHSLQGSRRLRVGDYRVIYRIDPIKHCVLITAIGHRKDIYD